MRTHQYVQRKKASQSSHPLVPQPSDVQSSVQSPLIQAKSNEEGLAEHAERLRKFQRLGTSFTQMGPPSLGKNKTNPLQPKAWIQKKMALGPPRDKFELEADRVASQVVMDINAPSIIQLNLDHPIWPKRKSGLEIPMKGISAAIQLRQAIVGGETSQDFESAINSTRGGGQSLDSGLQESMGQVMGMDFSEVRVHTDSQSDQLNQSIQTRAFTTGQDVFFRKGAYQPRNRGGQELIAHELTHVMQQSEEGAPNVTPTQRRFIQCKVGFELEAGEWRVYKLGREPTVREAIDHAIPYTATPVKHDMEKGTSFYDGKGFQATVDELGSDKDLEYVTKPFAEDDDSGLKKTMDRIVNKTDELVKAEKKQSAKDCYVWPEAHAGMNPPGSSGGAWLLKNLGDNMRFRMQATAGIRLDQIQNLLASIGQPVENSEEEIISETEVEGKRREEGRGTLISATGEGYVAGEAAYWAQQAVKSFVKKPYPPKDKTPDPGIESISKDSKHLQGLLTVIGLYIRTGAQHTRMQYPKEIASLMARTDFATLFTLLPKEQQTYLAKDKGTCLKYLVRLSLGDFEISDFNFPLFAQEKFSWQEEKDKPIFRELTCDAWIVGITQGQDRLTQSGFVAWVKSQDLKKEEAKEHASSGEWLESLGGMGSKMDTLPKGLKAPIFEFRALRNKAEINGSYNAKEAKEVAVKFLEYINNLNSLRDKTYGE